MTGHRLFACAYMSAFIFLSELEWYHVRIIPFVSCFETEGFFMYRGDERKLQARLTVDLYRPAGVKKRVVYSQST